MSHDPLDGYSVDDLFSLPDLPRRTELIDGSLVFRRPQGWSHANAVDLLVSGLRQTAPEEFKVRWGMTVILDQRNAPEPDACVIHASAHKGSDQDHYLAADLTLAVEVVTPETESRDRTTKPYKYAAAGIPNYWRVERDRATHHLRIHVYALDPLTGAYVHTGLHRDHLKLNAPYDIDIDLTTIHQL